MRMPQKKCLIYPAFPTNIVNILFVKSTNNNNDMHTQNLGQEMFDKHSQKYMELVFETEALLR